MSDKTKAVDATVAPVVETPVVETLETKLAGMSKEEVVKYILDAKALKDLKATVAKAPGHKENLKKALELRPMTAEELAKELNTTVKTVQSYICYARKDGVEILQIAGKYRILDAAAKIALGITPAPADKK